MANGAELTVPMGQSPTGSRSADEGKEGINRVSVRRQAVLSPEALKAPGRPGVRVIAARFGVNPGTVQSISAELVGRPFDGSAAVA
jgi:hypothetical protein